MKMKILCIEDDPTIQALVQASLKEFDVVLAGSLSEAGQQLKDGKFSAILSDIELPDGDGLRFVTNLTADKNYKSIPVLILSHHDAIPNKVIAFSIGAEDFIGKPFDPIELNARVRARIRRYAEALSSHHHNQIGDILIDLDRQKAFRVQNGVEWDLQLTSLELKILSLLTKRLEQVYSRLQIMQDIWGCTHIADRTIDSHIAHLRQKMDGSALRICTAKNFGYYAKLSEHK